MSATSVPIINPAGYVTQHAIAVSDGSGAASAVHAGNPLPVSLTPREAPTPSPLIGETSDGGVFGPFAPLPGRPIWLTLAGSWSGVVTVQRSSDGIGERNALNIADEMVLRSTLESHQSDGLTCNL